MFSVSLIPETWPLVNTVLVKASSLKARFYGIILCSARTYCNKCMSSRFPQHCQALPFYEGNDYCIGDRNREGRAMSCL